MYTKSYSLTAGDIDINYRMTPSAALLYFQDTYAAYLAHHRIGAFDIVKEHKLWVISDFDLHFIGNRVLWLDDFEVKVNFSEITSCRAYVHFEFRLVATGRLFAEGESCWTVLDFQNKRPCNIVEILDRAQATDAGERHKKVNPRIADPVLKTSLIHKVNNTDLDFNGHVCNRSYMRMAMSTIPVEFTNVSSPLYVHIKFAKESFLGQTLNVNVYEGQENPDLYFQEICNEAGDKICTVYTEWKSDREWLAEDLSQLITR